MNRRKYALVTGARGGVGSAITDELLAAGWVVFAGIRTTDGHDERADRTEIPLDVTDTGSIAAAAATIAERSEGHLDAVINNAAISVDGPLELLDAEDFRALLDVNVVGPVNVTAAFLPLLRASRGHVVNIGGAAGRSALPFYGPLSASKAALDALSDSLRMELRDQGVRVSYIEPGGLDTGFFARSSQAAAAAGENIDPPLLAPYAKAFTAAQGSMLTGPHDSPQTVAHAVRDLLDRERPVARVRVGRQAKYLLPTLRKLPVRLRDALVLRELGVETTPSASQG